MRGVFLANSWGSIGRSVFRLRTLPPPTGGSAAVREEVVRRSRARYGRPRAGAPRNQPPTSLNGLNPGEAL